MDVHGTKLTAIHNRNGSGTGFRLTRRCSRPLKDAAAERQAVGLHTS
jgi:hypothetical protein